MKKIIIVLVVFISSIIFYDSYMDLSQQQYKDVINLAYKVAQERNMDVVPVDLQLSENKKERQEQFNQVYSFLQEHSYSCFVGMVSKNVNTEYVYLSGTTDLPVDTEENKEVDFTKNTNHYLSSSYKDKNRYATIDFIDSSYHSEYNTIYRIKSFSNYIQNWNGNTLFPLYFVTDSKKDLIRDLNQANIISDLKVDGDITTSDFSLDKIDYSFLKRILMYLSIAVLLCLLSDVFTSRKEVFIRKMQGATTWFIYKRLYGKLYVSSIFLFSFIQFLLYVFVVHNFRPVTHILIQYLMCSVLLFVCCMGIVGVILYMFLHQIQSVVLLKKTEYQWISRALFVLKCVFLISIFIPLFTSLNYTTQVMQDGYFMKKYEENYNHYLRLEGVNINMFSLKFSNTVLELKEKIKQYPYIYEDYSLKTNRDGEEITHPYIFVNKEYLKDYTLYKDGKRVESIQTGTIYAPKSINANETYCLASKCEYEQIDEGYTMVSHSFNEENWHVKNPIIYVVDDKDELDLFNMYISDKNQSVKQSLDNYLKENGLYQSINFGYENDDYEQKMSVITKLIIDSTILLIVYICVLVLFQYQAIYLYFLENRKLIALNCLLGKNVWQKYRDFIIMNLLIYLILIFWMVLVVKNTKLEILILLSVMIGIDFVIAFLFKIYFEHKRVLLSLKGDLE